MINSNTRPIASAIAILAALLLAGPATADQVVYFVNGKAMTVKKVEPGDRITILEIDGGGRIGIPTEQIERIEDLVLSNPAPPPAIPAVQPGPQTQAPYQGGGAEGPLAVPAAAGAVGPMIGGRPTGPGGDLAGLKPIVIEGDGKMDATPVRGPAGARPGAQPAAGAESARGMPPGAFAPPPPPGGRNDALIARPGAPPARRFGARGGAFGRTRPPSVNYLPPQRPAAAATPPGAGQQPAAAQAPAPPPAPEEAMAEPPAGDEGAPPEESVDPSATGSEGEIPPVEESDEPPADDAPEN